MLNHAKPNSSCTATVNDFLIWYTCIVYMLQIVKHKGLVNQKWLTIIGLPMSTKSVQKIQVWKLCESPGQDGMSAASQDTDVANSMFNGKMVGRICFTKIINVSYDINMYWVLLCTYVYVYIYIHIGNISIYATTILNCTHAEHAGRDSEKLIPHMSDLGWDWFHSAWRTVAYSGEVGLATHTSSHRTSWWF